VSKSYVYALRLRLFLEGVEVPIISANVQTAPNSPSVASLQVLPLDEGTKLLPRTVVHLFFLDNYQVNTPYVHNVGDYKHRESANPTMYEQALKRVEKRTGKTADPFGVITNENLSEDDRVDIRSSKYKVLFSGEVVGFQWVKAPHQRSLVLQCEDFSNYWDYAYQSGGGGLFGPGMKAMFSGAATNLFTDPILGSPGGTVAQIVSAGKCNTFPNMKGLAAGIVRLIEAIGGSYYPPPRPDGKAPQRYRGQNLFFSIAELRLHLTQMVTALEKDPTSESLMRARGYSGLFNRRVGGLGGQASIRKCINAMTAVMFYETYAQPCPAFVPGTPVEDVKKVRRSFRDAPETKPLVEYAESIALGMGNVAIGIETFRLSGGFAGVSAESKADLRAQENNAKTDVLRSLKSMRGVAISALRKCGFSPTLANARKLFTEMSYNLGLLQARIPYMRPRASSRQWDQIEKSIDVVLKNALKIPDLVLHSKESSTIMPHRLNQHVLRPDLWFSAPPRCNVIFPEVYNMYTYERAFLKEPTRLLLKTHDEFFGEDFLFDSYYFAPQAGSLRSSQAQLRDVIRNDLLTHELFTGILPVFEKMGEFNLFAARRAGDSKLPGKISYAQRAANFIYFKHKFNARKARVSGFFNPYIACGFPGLVLDRYIDAQKVAEHNEMKERLRNSPEASKWGVGGMQGIDLSAGLGTHYLANFTASSHMATQQGGNGKTEIVCSYPRQPNEDIEFLGVGVKDRTVKRRMSADAKRTTDVAALTAPRIHSLGPNNGKIINVKEVTHIYAGPAYYYTPQYKELLKSLGQLQEGKKIDLYVPRRRSKGAAGRTIKVPVGIPINGNEYGPEITELSGGRSINITLKAYRIDEEIPRYRREKKELPVEEYIKPGWYGDVWSSAKIGEAYNYFFKTGAITDAQQVVDVGDVPRGDSNLNANDGTEDKLDAESKEDPKAQAPGIIALDKDASIQDAVEFILFTYSYIKMNDIDVEEFIKSYVWRPIATMVDMFGTSDLTLSSDGRKVLQGIEGFHSRAFGPYGDLFGLVPPDIRSIVKIKEGSNAAQAGDTRLAKLLAVQKYATAVRFTRALLG